MDNRNRTRMEWNYLLHKGSVLKQGFMDRDSTVRDEDAYMNREKPTMAFAQIYLTQLRKFCDEEEHAVKAEKLKSNGKIYGEPNSYKMVSQSQIESCLERVQASV